MDIKDFVLSFTSNVKESADKKHIDYDEELAASIIEYMEECGEVNAPIICSFQKTRARITAYDYNDEAESLDLFYLIRAESIAGKVNNSKVNRGFEYLKSFYKSVINNTIFRNAHVSITDEISEVVKLVQSTKGKVNLLRLYILTDGLTNPFDVPTSSDFYDFTIEYNVWDMQRVFQQYNIIAGKEVVLIDLPKNYNTELQCLKLSDNNPYVEAYLAVIQGETLGKIYKQYHQILLEKNVRTFLQFKGKVNKGIRTTLRTQPDMFFSYNNGISSTASKIDFKKKQDGLYITRLYNWQIVNGGQTTASIAALLNDRDVDMSNVFVPMKISVIKDTEHYGNIIKAISTFANSQTSIKNSDFSANEPYLVELENFSRSEWVPNGKNKPFNKWYFERTRGQYLDQLSQLNGFSERLFKIEYPKRQKITKTDIAKFESCWQQRPFDACKGAEQNFKLFATEIKNEKPQISALYYHNLVAKAILYNTIDASVKAKNYGGYKSYMNAYIMASVSFLSNRNLDLTFIWDNQRLQIEVIEKISELIPLVWNHIISELDNSNGRILLKAECWTRLKSKLNSVQSFNNKVLMKCEVNDIISPNANIQGKVMEAQSYNPDFWFKLAIWAKNNDFLTPMERKSAFNFGTMQSRGRKINSLKQALFALSIVEKAEEKGFCISD